MYNLYPPLVWSPSKEMPKYSYMVEVQDQAGADHRCLSLECVACRRLASIGFQIPGAPVPRALGVCQMSEHVARTLSREHFEDTYIQ